MCVHEGMCVCSVMCGVCSVVWCVRSVCSVVCMRACVWFV